VTTIRTTGILLDGRVTRLNGLQAPLGPEILDTGGSTLGCCGCRRSGRRDDRGGSLVVVLNRRGGQLGRRRHNCHIRLHNCRRGSRNSRWCRRLPSMRSGLAAHGRGYRHGSLGCKVVVSTAAAGAAPTRTLTACGRRHGRSGRYGRRLWAGNRRYLYRYGCRILLFLLFLFFLCTTLGGRRRRLISPSPHLHDRRSFGRRRLLKGSLSLFVLWKGRCFGR
jgi:hypothetical protein